MGNIEYVDDLNGIKGRPVSNRTNILKGAIELALAAGKHGMRVVLEDDETGDKFYRFDQRCRSAAKLAGVRVSVGRSREGDVANVRIIED